MVQNRRLPKRDRRLTFRLAPEEYAALETEAAQHGQTVSAFIRAAFPALVSESGRIQKSRRRPQDADTSQCLAMLSRIHRNVEGLGEWVERHRQGADAVSITAHLVVVEREIDRLRATLAQQA